MPIRNRETTSEYFERMRVLRWKLQKREGKKIENKTILEEAAEELLATLKAGDKHIYDTLGRLGADGIEASNAPEVVTAQKHFVLDKTNLWAFGGARAIVDHALQKAAGNKVAAERGLRAMEAILRQRVVARCLNTSTGGGFRQTYEVQW